MKKILLAEDDKDQRDSITSRLNSAGYEVIAVGDGQQALDCLNTTLVDLVILDIIMPVLNGLEVLEVMRKTSKLELIPVIILTNLDTTDESLQQIIRDRPAYYLLKSNIQLSDLIEKVKTAIHSPNLTN